MTETGTAEAVPVFFVYTPEDAERNLPYKLLFFG